MSKPYAVKVTFTKILSPTTQAYLETKQGAENVETWADSFLAVGERLAIDWVNQWIEEGSVVPTISLVARDGHVIDERKRKIPRRDIENRPY